MYINEESSARLPVIALVGRPNVGKSTLFNQFARGKKSIVNDEPGATRDRLYTQTTAADMCWHMVDTGGIDLEDKRSIFESVREQSQVAIAEADVVVFMVDAVTGVMPADEEVARLLRQSKKPVVVAVNKAETDKLKHSVADFYRLGFRDVVAISGAHKHGLQTLFEVAASLLDDALVSYSKQVFEAKELAKEEAARKRHSEEPAVANTLPEVLKLAVIGKPNAGKSSFVNKLLGEERHVTSPIPGTTMDAVDSEFSYAGQQYLLIDTAGIRRKRSIDRGLEKQAVSRALDAMDRADIALLIIDAMSGVTEQDLKVVAFAHDKGKGLVIVINKWDLAKAEGLDADIYAKQIRSRMPFVAYAPIRFVSAMTGSRVFDVLETVMEVADAYFKRIPTSKVNALLEEALGEHQLPLVSGRRVKLFFGSQVAVAPPTFIFTSNDADGVHFSYQRFLQNRIRNAFGFKGVPLKLIFKSKEQKADKS